MGKQLFEADGRYLGQREVPNFQRSSLFGHHITSSFCYFCPKCGEIWGRLHHEGGYWQLCIRNCQRHGDGRLSELYDRYGDFQPALLARDWPREALLREFLIELNDAR